MNKKLILIVLITFSVLSTSEILRAKSKPFENESSLISFDKLKIDYAGTENQFIVSVRGIIIVPPKLKSKDTLRKAILSFDVKIKNSDVKVEGFSLSGEPKIEKEGDSYTVQFILLGKIPFNERTVRGKVYFNVGAIAKNPTSGKVSKRTEHGTEIDIDFRPLKN